MDADQSVPKTVDEYIGAFPEDVREILEKIRALVREAAPEAQETIKYAMPTFVLHGNLLHFAAFKHHIGLYPTPSGTAEFKQELAAYESGKGSIKFPLDKPIPFDLVDKIVRFRAAENREKAAKSKNK